ncbi:hypothetical protein FIBSPDRAFT_808285 [Athelia psychrophila]|uniref:AIG1-type G domain-containing protein n=1 Tax=Athelia psychrophila TaxID=1759441 RepID=A0A167TF53_9AGAM|nr:hypothetical protein FIBSPDRAFT_808285 [Fibularhizoctonia sp. CBS 109695]
MLPKRRRGPSPHPLGDDQVRDVPKTNQRTPGNDLFIAVMGLAGAGNSSFVNMALGRDACPVGTGQKPITVEIQAHRRGHPNGSGRNIVFIDTPGIQVGGEYEAADDVLWAILRWLTAEYQGNVLLTGILFMHRITDNRALGGEMRTTLLQALCGRSDLLNVVLVTTMCDEVVEEATITKRVADLQKNFWGPMISNGSRVDSSYRHTQAASAWDILTQFELHPPQNNQS